MRQSNHSMENKNLKLIDLGTPQYIILKRLMDIVGSLVFILVFSPVYLITAILIFLQDRHNPLYTQSRVGLLGKTFQTYKFRSMVHNADEIMRKDAKLYAQLRSGNNKIVDDPRITRVGKFLRKYSIDEFPQMFNVLLGQMSLVGPRPLRPDEFELAVNKSSENKSTLERICTVKPGITGYWQTHGRSNVDFDTRMKMEYDYATKKSLLLDIQIILRTPYAVLKGDGAY
ncbi:MAG: sugar transferase [Thermosphaera sp.]